MEILQWEIDVQNFELNAKLFCFCGLSLRYWTLNRLPMKRLRWTMDVTSFSNISYRSNSEYWPLLDLDRQQSGKLYDVFDASEGL